MDTALIVDGFVTRYGGLINRYLAGDKDGNANKSTINDLLGQVTVIANDPDGKSAISSVQYHETKTTKRLSIEFDTTGAKTAKEILQIQKATLDLAAYEPIENKLLVFEQTSIRATETGKRTNLKGRIESVHSKPLPVIFETDLARERIESEIREDEKNVYKKGFFVDCYAERVSGRPVAYRITDVRLIIPLPEDEGKG